MCVVMFFSVIKRIRDAHTHTHPNTLFTNAFRRVRVVTSQHIIFLLRFFPHTWACTRVYGKTFFDSCDSFNMNIECCFFDSGSYLKKNIVFWVWFLPFFYTQHTVGEFNLKTLHNYFLMSKIVLKVITHWKGMALGYHMRQVTFFYIVKK